MLTAVIYALAGVSGIVALLYPFFLPALDPAALEEARTAGSPLLTALLLTVCVVVLLLEVQGQAVSSKVVAALGLLIAVAGVLRFVEVAIPGPGGFSPIFAPIILAGYVFGARFGFLMGTLSLLVSGLITGGIGPWLPYQMFAAGWVGMTAGWLPHPRTAGREAASLVAFGFGWGLLYGALLNLTFWPYAVGVVSQRWQPGIGAAAGLQRYLVFYLTTSLVWDLFRAFGNAILLGAIGVPAVRALTRFRDRFQFAWRPA